MKRPERLRIFGKRVTVRWVEKVTADDGEEVMGLADHDNQDIQIKEGMPLETEQEKVLHETMHMIECAMEMDLEEEVISRFATGLLAVLKDNPGLVSYLRQRGRAEPSDGVA